MFSYFLDNGYTYRGTTNTNYHVNQSPLLNLKPEEFDGVYRFEENSAVVMSRSVNLDSSYSNTTGMFRAPAFNEHYIPRCDEDRMIWEREYGNQVTYKIRSEQTCETTII